MISALVVGLVQGGTYALIALGLVLCYRGTRVLNFAQAEIGAASLFIAWIVIGAWHKPYWMGALVAITFAVAIGLTFERLIVRPMAAASRLTVAVGTIGLFGFLVAAEAYLNGPTPRFLPPPIKGSVDIAGVAVSFTQILTFGVIAVIALGLTAFLRRTDFGLGVLASAQDATAARLVGIPQAAVSMFTWGVASALSALAALLIAPTITYFGPNAIGPQLFIGGLASALLGGLTSLGGAIAGGLVVGVLASEATQIAPNGVAGIYTVVLFAIVVGVLLIRPQGLLGSAPARAESG